jgi:hypothetical protein
MLSYERNEVTHTESTTKNTDENERRYEGLPIEIVNSDQHPDTLAVHIGNKLAGAAIEDHFLDVVLPTLATALNAQEENIIGRADEHIRSKLERDLSAVVEPVLGDLIEQAVSRQVKFEPGMSVEIYDPARQRTKRLNRQHMLFPVLLRMMCVRDRNGNPLNIAINGPAGNGKTSMALSTADALGLDAILQPFNPQTTKSDLLGYMDATGKYVPSPFYEAFKHGKVYVADEFDAANPAIAITLNAAVANRRLTFPNLETVKAHPNFRPLFIMNTRGTGADHQYTGRFRQDAATLDRLVQLHVPIDSGLEAAIAGVTNQKSEAIRIEEGGHFSNNLEILELVKQVRRASEELNMKYIFSPRAVLHATALHAADFGKKWIMDCCIWRGMPEHDRQAISEKIGLK